MYGAATQSTSGSGRPLARNSVSERTKMAQALELRLTSRAHCRGLDLIGRVVPPSPHRSKHSRGVGRSQPLLPGGPILAAAGDPRGLERLACGDIGHEQYVAGLPLRAAGLIEESSEPTAASVRTPRIEGRGDQSIGPQLGVEARV